MVAGRYIPDAGHLISINFDPQAGHEQAGWRPALVLSPASYNAPTNLAIVVPVTNQAKGYPFEVALPIGLKVTGVILADALKNLDWRVRKARYLDIAPPEVLAKVQELVRLLLGLDKE
jgi:mRNA interferase MazF